MNVCFNFFPGYIFSKKCYYKLLLNLSHRFQKNTLLVNTIHLRIIDMKELPQLCRFPSLQTLSLKMKGIQWSDIQSRYNSNSSSVSHSVMFDFLWPYDLQIISRSLLRTSKAFFFIRWKFALTFARFPHQLEMTLNTCHSKYPLDRFFSLRRIKDLPKQHIKPFRSTCDFSLKWP